MTWFQFCFNVDWYLAVNPGNRPLYIHAYVHMPIEPNAQSRVTLYMMFERMIPSAVHRHVLNVRYRMRFIRIPETREEIAWGYHYNREEVTVTRISLRQAWSPRLHDDGIWTGDDDDD